MVTLTLDDQDLAVLRRLCRADADVESLAESVPCRPEYLRDRLPELADNGLVQRDGDGYAITANGKRVLAGSPAGAMDHRIDTPSGVERRIQSFDLRPDRKEAVRNAFAFLHYWGAASEAEIIDGVYSENPAGFDSGEEWWTDCVRDHLADLPSVERDRSTAQEWRYSGTPIVEKITEDGRIAVDDEEMTQTSVKYAIEQTSLTEDERSAVRAAFEFLAQEGEVTASEIRSGVYPDYDAGFDSAREWWTDCVRDALGSLPGVERTDDTRDVWEYAQADEQSVSSDPEAESSDGPPESRDESDG